MIKRIHVVSRKQVEHWIDKLIHPFDKEWALISICGSYELLNFVSIRALQDIKCRHTISLKFHDLSEEQYKRIKKVDPKTKVKLFSKDNAQSILNFIDDVKQTDIENLVVHCAAGISRSGAVGLFLCRYLQLNEEKFREKNKICPNFYIVNKLNEVSGLNKDYVKWWEENLKEERQRLSIITEKQFMKDLW